MRFLFCLLLAFCLALSVQGKVFAVIDTFATIQPPLIFTVVNGDATQAENVWYSPYNMASPPVAAYVTTTNCLGGQRDLIIGYETVTPTNSVAVASVTARSGSVSLPLDYVGGVYFQYDGTDNQGTSNPFPGSTLNSQPGIGSANNIYSTDGRSMDFTFGGRAKFVTVTVFADHECSYFFDAIDTSDRDNTYEVLVAPVSETVPVLLFVSFQSNQWDNPAFDFTKVAAFQVRVFTFSDADSGGPQAVDTSFKFLNITGYEIAGTVVVDCLCDSTTDSFVVGSTVTLSNPSTGTTLDTTTTDVNGAFAFYGFDAGSYRVCISAGLSRCASTPQCRDVTMSNLVDPAPLFFATTISSVLTIPGNQNLECGACTTPACLGFASTSGCSGTNQVNTFTDSTTTVGCVTTIRRTWTANGQSDTQVITVTDTLAPVINTQASSLTFPCNAVTTSITTWIADNGGARATDCSTFTWSNNWDNTAPVQCGSDVVTFTARDICAHTSSTTATYTITDNVPPTITTAATNQRAECDLRTNTDQNALNAWVNNHGGAVATDNCGTITWTNNFTPLTSGCNVQRTVTFTANDGCATPVSTTATFTISDTTNPTITQSAQAATAQCSSGTSATQTFNDWRNNHGGARATDACTANDNLLVWTDDFTGVVTGGCNSQFTVTFTVTDACGRSSTTSSTFTVLDTTGPTLTAPAQAQLVECGTTDIPTAYTAWLNNNGGATATDSCTAVSWSNNAGPAPTNGCSSASTVTFRATDTCNNAAVQTTATFTVRDSTPPTFSIPPTGSGQECDGNVQVGFSAWLANNAGATATDTCSTPVRIVNDFPVNGTPSLGCNAATTVRFTAIDNCNQQSAPVTAAYTVTDTTPPTISPLATDASRECNVATNGQDYATFLATRGGANASDFCSAFTWTNDGPTTLSFTCSISQTVTFTARDVCNNAARTTATFSITDTAPPVISQPATDRTTQCSSGTGTQNDLTSWLNSRGGAVATDACGAVTWTNNYSGTLTIVNACTSLATVSFTAADACGHSVATTATFTVTDSIGPTINPPAQALTVQCDPDSNDDAYANWIATHAGAAATDNCVPAQNLIWTASDPLPLSDSCSSQSVTFTVSDGCGSSAFTTAVFTIIDNVKPGFTTPPQNQVVECDGAGNVAEYNLWVSTFAGAVATDVCATVLTYASNAPLTGPVGCGAQPQTITVTDECNNSAIGSSVFTVDDTQAPTIVTPAVDATIQCNPSTNPADISAFLSARGGATASDICYAATSLSWTNNYVGLSTAACNPTARVTFTVADPCGNSATTTASVTIVDTLVPILSSAATPVVFECNSETNQASISTYVNTHGGAQATDSCSAVTWTHNYVTGPVPCAGALPIIFTASDACGNRVISTGSVEIVDTVAPMFVNFPGDVTVGCDQCREPDCTGVPSWSDACTTGIIPTHADVSFQEPTEKFCPGDIIITRTWTIVDSCGNVNTKDQIIVEEIARSTGPCLPSECPPCELVECCTRELDGIECNPVPCTAVTCLSVHCNAVPCIPRSCGVPPTPTGRPEGPVPLPSSLPAPSCEPVYIYVFDDDGEDIPDPIINYTTQNDSSTLGVSLISLVIILFVTIF